MSIPKCVAALCALAAALVGAAPAAAWTASNTGGGQVTISDELGAPDAFSLVRLPGGCTVTNPASPFSGSAPAGCLFDADAQVLACSEALVLGVTVAANGGDDTVTSEVPVSGLGGDGIDTLVGSAGVDDLDGGPGADLLDGGEGNDRLAGGTGSDQLIGGDGVDLLDGGAGDDNLDGSAGDDALSGGDDDDTLEGGSGADVLGGGDGADVLSGGSGIDTLAGDAGDDEIAGGTDADAAAGGPGNDRINGEAGDDDLSGGDGGDEIEGGAGADRGAGGAGADDLAGGPDADRLLGEEGDDQLAGDDGGDDLDGGAGDDRLELGPGDDNGSGGDGRDRIEAGAGIDAVSGGAGDDELVGSDAPGRAALIGDGGNDRLSSLGRADDLAGGDGADVLEASGGDDVVDGGPGEDLLRPGAGGDGVSGGAGRDVVSFDDVAIGGVLVSLDGVANDGTTGTGNVGVDIEEVVGSDGDDGLRAGPAGTVLTGGPGADTLIGGPAGDYLRGGFGDDLLDGGGGGDLLEGNEDIDTVTYAARAARVVVRLDGAADDGAAGERDLVSVTVEVVVGGSGPDDLVGARDVANTLVGGAGDDRLDARSTDGAPDVLQCGGGTDTAYLDTIDTEAGDCEIVVVDGIQTRSIAATKVAPRVTFGSRRLALGSEGVAVVVLRCGPRTDRSCRGTVTMRLRIGRLLGSAKWSALPGQRRGIRIPLPARRVRSLRRPRQRIVNVRLLVNVADAAGRRRTVKANAKLRLPATRRR